MKYWHKIPRKQCEKYNKVRKEKYANDPEKKAWKIKVYQEGKEIKKRKQQKEKEENKDLATKGISCIVNKYEPKIGSTKVSKTQCEF